MPRLVPSIFPAQDCKIALLAEAPGSNEDRTGVPLVGTSGRESDSMCAVAGISRSECYIGNVFSYRPPNNDILAFCGKKSEMPTGYNLPPLSKGHYVKPEFLELDRIKEELERVKPNVVVAYGNTPLWALTGQTGIGQARGRITLSTLVPGLKVLPTYHPAYVLRSWDYRVIVIRDLLKARQESEYPDVRSPRREFWLEPTIDDLLLFEQKYMLSAPSLSLDIETSRVKELITMVGVSPDPGHALVIPFCSKRKDRYSYWKTLEEEVEAWLWLQRWCRSSTPKILQNGLYDLYWLLEVGISVRRYVIDTMLQHHARFPELPKDLGFLGASYTNEVNWKMLSPRKRDKREE